MTKFSLGYVGQRVLWQIYRDFCRLSWVCRPVIGGPYKKLFIALIVFVGFN